MPAVPNPQIIDRNFNGTVGNDLEDYPDGLVFVIDKPYRWTSSDVVRKMKFALQHHFRRKNIKVGHAGTLDPLATGILLICAGKATKSAGTFQSHDKEYVAEFQFGATTPTFDLEQPIDKRYPDTNVTLAGLEKAICGFIGRQKQIPPLFSAKMVEGVRAYQIAREAQAARNSIPMPAEKGDTDVRMKPSEITISGMEILSFGTPAEKDDKRSRSGKFAGAPDRFFDFQHPGDADPDLPTASIRITCSKGTYIRAIARDLGLALGTGAYMSALIRSASGNFKIKDALLLDEALELLCRREDDDAQKKRG
ncbi:MAG: tRNA pseudouridine(55) synthase TruB [Bacteroidales bacterium]|jgi:tRNA pseudouridine55 synthase|nr:tRNA pseudouridine(55) synthase TruB [Bacteroidales bacterium]MCI2122225.1 tRNA pseudouridine(55) synthase TruB [Bacteroidales bacterium]MCI2145561.1 tRNA pseudouridine(55) synthase TruB [Bacteroidales bacterium]